MRHLLQDEAGKAMTELLNSDGSIISCRGTDLYLELEQRLANGQYLVWYLVPVSTTSHFIATCWTNLEDMFRTVRDGNIDIADFIYKWPSMQELIKNGTSHNYGECALVRDSDLDTGSPAWFLLSFVGNQRIDSLSDLFEGRVGQTMQRVIRKSGDLLHEIATESPSLPGVLWKTLKREVRTSPELIIDFLGGLAGALSCPDRSASERLKRDFDSQTEAGAKRILERLLS